MKKLIILGVVVLALVITPYFIGTKAESLQHEFITKMDSNPNFQMSIESYDRGWFSSRSIVKLTFPSLSPNSKDGATLSFQEKIQHGPLLWKTGSIGLGWADFQVNWIPSDELQNQLGQLNIDISKLLTITNRTNFGLSNNIHLQSQPINFEKETNKIDITAAEANMLINANDGFVKLDFSWQGMQAEQLTSGDKLTIGNITLNSQQQLAKGEFLSPSALYDADFKANISEVNFVAKHPSKNFSITPLNIKSSSNLKDDLFNAYMNISSEKIIVGAIQQNFDSFKWDIVLESLDANTLQEMGIIASEANNAQNGASQNPAMMLAKIQGLLPKLAEKNPIIKINQLGLNTSDGKIDSNLTIKIDQKVYQPNNPMTMMFAIDAKATGFAPEAFFAKLGMGPVVEQYIEQNFLVRDNGNLKFELNFQKGQALLNGKPMPFF